MSHTMEPVEGWLRTAGCITRHPANPIITHSNMPVDSSCVYNPAVVKYQGKYVMIIRNDVGEWGKPEFDHTELNLASSKDGIHWEIDKQPCFRAHGGRDVRDAYDPRLTVMDDGRVYLCYAVDGTHGFRAGIARTDDFHHWETFGLSTPDNRDVVLFPQKFGGRYLRLERPMPVYSRHGLRHDIWSGCSPDLRYWGDHELLLTVEDVPYANQKIGAGAPPLKTKRGWLHIIHAVEHDPERGKNGWEEKWDSRYYAGLMLTDLEEPTRILGISKRPLLSPEAPYETSEGYRNHVIFPTAAVLEDTGEVKIYYGAADSFVCLASADLGDLLNLVEPL